MTLNDVAARNKKLKMKKVIIALGSDIKNRVLIAKGSRLWHSSDVGDLSDAANFEKFKSNITSLIEKVRRAPDIIACDLHPGYFSTRFAREYSRQFPASKIVKVQHHHAHIASVIYDHNLKTPVLGVSFDGTGYGSDGNMWGGEFLLVDKCGFKRLAHLKYRKMPGADRVVYEPWRMVLSILGKGGAPFLYGIKKEDKQLVLSMMTKNINSPLSSSAGRMFDAAAALLGICRFARYEAEGPIKLESICEKHIREKYAFDIRYQKGYYVIDTDQLFTGIARDLKKKENEKIIATRFHNSISEIIISMVKRLSERYNVRTVALSGGVFQNKFLTMKVLEKMHKLGFNVHINKSTPVNDLNISLGQYYVSSCTGKN